MALLDRRLRCGLRRRRRGGGHRVGAASGARWGPPKPAGGHCYDDPSTSAAGSPQEVACADPHDEEVYYVFDLTESSYPGDTAIQEESDPQCGAALPAYTGDHASQYYFSYYSPDQFSWSLGDRVVACVLSRAPGSDHETSGGTKLRGTARSTS
ncbi:septum formation family protein [Terracoccus sp. 273MFTsu3.1]|uniref:septum formation family protein n=1 Tax=Terracoccus sp. 273MFTsu3.1 TaxID=1172188 RepID=UPI0009DC40B9|nr:septum formation family protein [Terracoccus sp. 273MFTsu3.1]